MAKKSFFSKWFSLILLGGIALGAIAGLIFGEKAAVVKPLGDIFLNLMFTIVVPLVFVSIAMAVGNMVDMKRLGKILGSTVAVFIVTGAIAAIFVLVTVTVFPPAQGANIVMDGSAQMGTPKTAGELIVSSLTVSDFPELLSRRNMLPLIVFAILFGLAVSMSGGKESAVGKLLNNLNDVIMKLVDFIMKFAPIGLGAYFAALIGEFGPQLIGDYGRALLIYYPLVFLYVGIMFPVYAYWAGGKEGLSRMLKNIFSPAITAFATQSSVATIPVNKKACENIGVPDDVSDIVLPMGATMHMDGSVISSILKISFLYGIFGMPFTGVGTFAMSFVVAILSAFVLSGVPGGGLVGEMLIVSMFNFPPEAFPIIAMIGFLVDPPATMANSSGDTIASMMVTRLVEGKDWIKKHIVPAREA
jgi:Na+/H+-dicarboxylate symporter